jgi:hypothetical protein
MPPPRHAQLRQATPMLYPAKQGSAGQYETSPMQYKTVLCHAIA